MSCAAKTLLRLAALPRFVPLARTTLDCDSERPIVFAGAAPARADESDGAAADCDSERPEGRLAPVAGAAAPSEESDRPAAGRLGALAVARDAPERRTRPLERILRAE